VNAATIALVKAEVRARRRSFGALGAAVFVFLLALAGTYTALGGAAGLAQSFGRRPPAFFSAFGGSRNVNLFTPANYVGFGFLHPLFLVLALTVGISIGAAAIAGDIETGRAELLYPCPIRRATVLNARLRVWAGMQVAVVAAGVAGSWAGTRLSHDLRSVDPMLYVPIVAAYLPLAAVFGAVAFLASAMTRTRSHALSAAVGLAALAYLVNVVALLWHPLAWAQRLTPFGYYTPLDSPNDVNLANVAILLSVAVVLLVGAQWSLRRRDLV